MRCKSHCTVTGERGLTRKTEAVRRKPPQAGADNCLPAPDHILPCLTPSGCPSSCLKPVSSFVPTTPPSLYSQIIIRLHSPLYHSCQFICSHSPHVNTFLDSSYDAISLYKQTLLYCILLYCVPQMLHFLQIEGKTLHQQKDYNSLYISGLEPNPQYLQGMSVLLCSKTP